VNPRKYRERRAEFSLRFYNTEGIARSMVEKDSNAALNASSKKNDGRHAAQCGRDSEGQQKEKKTTKQATARGKK
jgi:hypothetical protein